MNREKGDYLSAGHYGVIKWDAPSGAVSAAARHDNGRWSVADPRLPEANAKLVCVIRALDGTWHRPFTTLELAALQSLVDPEEYLERLANRRALLLRPSVLSDVLGCTLIAVTQIMLDMA